MGLSIWQLAVVVILFVLLFGRGKLSGLMTDLADGIKSFRSSMQDSGGGSTGGESAPSSQARLSQHEPGAAADASEPETARRSNG